MVNEKQLKIERSFINLLLRRRTCVGDWIDSSLQVGHFDSVHHKILYGITEAFGKDVLLTRGSYIEFVNAMTSLGTQGALAEELLFNKINMLRTKPDDFPMLLDRILTFYLEREAIRGITEYEQRRSKKGVRVAISTLADDLTELSSTAMAEKKGVFEDISEYAPHFYQHLLDIRDGKVEEAEVIGCGINEIDYCMEVGHAPGTMTLYVADVGSFKSTMMLNIAANVWKGRGKNVLFIPLEMPRKFVFQKLISRETQIPFDKLTRSEQMSEQEVDKVREEIKSWDDMEGKFYMMEYVDRTKVSTIKREIEKHISYFNPDLVVVDYIANLLPDTNRNNRNDLEIGDMLKDLRNMGRNLGFHVVSGAQLGREALKRIRRQSSEKIMAYSEDVRGSHEYSADADFIFILMPDPQQPGSMIHLIPIKSRFGKKTFQDGRAKAALEVKPEISLIRSKAMNVAAADPNEVMEKASQDDSGNLLDQVVKDPDSLFDNDDDDDEQ